MVTVILIYVLIGWIAGFALTIYHVTSNLDLDELDVEVIPLILLCILYWPWFLTIIIYYFSKQIIKKLQNKNK